MTQINQNEPQIMDFQPCIACYRQRFINPSKDYQKYKKQRHVFTKSSRHILKSFLFFLTFFICQTSADFVYKVPLHKIPFRVEESVKESRDIGPESVSNGPLPSDLQNLKGKPGEGYYVGMEIGTPPQRLNVLVDTGSSNFAVAAAPHLDIITYYNTSDSSTYEDAGAKVTVPYTQGSWTGYLGNDLASLTSMDNITVETDIAFITESDNFFIQGSHWQGILGLAYAEIARPDPSVEPFIDALERQTKINKTFCLQMCGATSTDRDMGGSLVIGGIDPSLHTGKIYYVPIYKPWYYEIVITAISVDGNNVDIDCKEFNFDKTIVDSGTTNFRLPHAAYNSLLEMIQENTHTSAQTVPDLFWTGEDLLCWPLSDTPWSSFPPLQLSIATAPNASIALTISPQQYLRVVSDEEVVGLGLEGDNCYKFAISPSDTGTVLGAVFMEGYLVVFDRANNKVGFAVSTCPGLETANSKPKITGPYHHEDTMDCAYIKPENNQTALLLVAYILAGICGICLLPLAYMIIHWQVSRCRHRSENDGIEGTTSDARELLNEDPSDR